MVPKKGFEPPRAQAHTTLNRARLPIPPLGHHAGPSTGRVQRDAKYRPPDAGVQHVRAVLRNGERGPIFAFPSARPHPVSHMSAEHKVAQNRKARHDYEILDTVEAGLVLRGAEVKSVREGKVNLQDGWATVDRGEAWLHGVHISPYDPASRWNVDPVRSRKLLLSRDQIRALAARLFEQGVALRPLRPPLRNGYAKVKNGGARGKGKEDQREAIKRREMDREADRHAGRR